MYLYNPYMGVHPPPRKEYTIRQIPTRSTVEQFEEGIDWSRRPQLAHNFDKCTVRAIVKKATEKRGRDTDPGGGGTPGNFWRGCAARFFKS